MRQIFWGIIGGMAGFSFGFIVSLAILRDIWQLEKIVPVSIIIGFMLGLVYGKPEKPTGPKP